MSRLSYSEENYLKSIYHLAEESGSLVSTNMIAERMQTKPASATDMIKRLASKGVLNHEKYHGVTITKKGEKIALQVVRKHRLWEVFLVEKLKFNWDEVHEVAEQLEHIKSQLLISRLDEFLGFPVTDPHGDPIPDEFGEFAARPRVPLSEMKKGQTGVLVGVNDSSSSFLKYLDKAGIYIGARLAVNDTVDYDGSVEIAIDEKKAMFISMQVAENLLITMKK